MPEAADMKHNAIRIAKGMLMRTGYADALGIAGYLLSAAAAHEGFFVKTIRASRLPVRHAPAPAASLGTAKQHNLCHVNLTHSLPEQQGLNQQSQVPLIRKAYWNFLGSDQNKHHFKPLQGFKRVRLLGGHDDEFTGRYGSGRTRYGDFSLTIEHMHHRVKGRSVFA
jgi:hypothetical protein